MLFKDNVAAAIGMVVIFIIASLTDWFDGYTARKYDEVSAFGRFFDPLADKVLVLAVMVCLSVLGYFPLWMVIVIGLRDMIITALRSYAIAHNITVKTIFFAKAKTLVQMVVIYIVMLYHVLRLSPPGKITSTIVSFVERIYIIPILMWLTVVLTVATGLVYFILNRELVQRALLGRPPHSGS